MQTQASHTIQVTLVLDQDEAEWLHSVMQNPLYDQKPEEESAQDRDMRFRFFEATTLKG